MIVLGGRHIGSPNESTSFSVIIDNKPDLAALNNLPECGPDSETRSTKDSAWHSRTVEYHWEATTRSHWTIALRRLNSMKNCWLYERWDKPVDRAILIPQTQSPLAFRPSGAGKTVVYDSRDAIDLYTITHNNGILTETRLLGIDPHICRAKSMDGPRHHVVQRELDCHIHTYDAGVVKSQSLNSESRLIQHPWSRCSTHSDTSRSGCMNYGNAVVKVIRLWMV